MSRPEERSRKFLYAAVFTANLVGLAAGITIGWTSPVNPKLRDPNNPLGRVITDEEESWIGSLITVGAIFGPLIAGYASDTIGRKKTLLLCAGIPQFLGFILLAFGNDIIFYYIGRFLSGIGVGSVFLVLPTFNSEIAEDFNRGAIATSMSILIASGPLVSYAIGPYISIMWFSIFCAIIPAIFIVAFFLLVPESPYFLLARNDFDAAMTSLEKFRSSSSEDVKQELYIMKATVEEAIKIKVSFMDILKTKGLVKSLFISSSLIVFQQFSGINIVLFYTQNIFEATGSTISPEISPMIIGSVLAIVSFVAPIAVDRLGRKPLFLISAIGMVIGEFPLGLYFYLKDDGKNVNAISWLPILCLIIYITFYNIGFGPLPWTVMAEIFPTRVKTVASTATVSFCFVLGFIISKFFSNVSEAIGMGGSFWIFSGFCFVGIIFVLTCMFETKGKSFQEIQEILIK